MAIRDILGDTRTDFEVDSWESRLGLSSPEPLERRTVPDQLAHRIISLVKSGNLKAGDKLPSETELASAFQISRPSVREALKMLRMLGVTESRQGGRYYITDLSTDRLIKPIQFVVLLQGYDVEAHLEAREAVDLALLKLACERATPAEIQKLRTLAKTGHRFTADAVSFRLLDFEFHQTINAAARSPMLARIALSLYELGLEFRRIATETPGVIDVSVDDHDEIVEAIAARDADRAAAAYSLHLAHVRDTTQAAVEMLEESRRRRGAANPHPLAPPKLKAARRPRRPAAARRPAAIKR